MSLFGDIGRGALGWSTGGLSEILRAGTNRPGVPGAPPMRTPITAKDVTISPALLAALGGVGTTAQKAIGGAYDAKGATSAADSKARGLSPSSNSYGPARLATQQGLDVGNLESALGGAVGNTAYKDTEGQLGYDQNLALANEIADLNKPSLLEQILGGVGSVGPTVATFAGMRGKKSSASDYPTSAPGTLPPDLSLFDNSRFGYGRY